MPLSPAQRAAAVKAMKDLQSALHTGRHDAIAQKQTTVMQILSPSDPGWRGTHGNTDLVDEPLAVRQLWKRLTRPEWAKLTAIGADDRDESIEAIDKAAATLTTDNKADNTRKKLREIPENPEVIRLAKEIKKKRNARRSKVDVARGFTEGNEKEAKNLLRQLRRFPSLLS